jgi:RNA polymerase sigma-70 factor (ECF subfamily)
VLSSFSAARFPALPLRNERETADPLYKDTVVPAAEPSDRALIERIGAGDEEALRVLFRRYVRLVWSIAHRILRDRAEAEDVAQEVFLRVHQKTSAFDPTKGPPRTLIVYMTYRLAFNRRRYLAARHAHYVCPPREEVDLSAAMPSFYDESMEAHFGRDGLRNAFAELSADQRETLRLYFFEGFTLDEIASRLGQSLGNVRHHYFRGLGRLRRALQAIGPRP